MSYEEEICAFTNVIAFYDKMTGFADERRAVNVFYFKVSKAFSTFSHYILTDELVKKGFKESMAKLTKS